MSPGSASGPGTPGYSFDGRSKSDLNLRDLDASYGVGLRLHSNSAFVARLDLAFSREGFIPLLRFEHVF